MKKNLSIFLIIVFCFTFIHPVNAQENPISVIINGRVISFDVEPQSINGRTFVPMRKIFEEMGATINYDAKTQTITATKGDKTVMMQVGSKSLSVNGTTSTMDVAPTIVDSRTLVPIRAVSQSLNATVEWNDVLKKVLIFDWDSITNTVPYYICSSFPDFGKYVGLDCTDKWLARYYDGDMPRYTYEIKLGTNKESILEDYKKVLEKNGFILADVIYTVRSLDYVCYEKIVGDYDEIYHIFLPKEIKDDDTLYVFLGF